MIAEVLPEMTIVWPDLFNNVTWKEGELLIYVSSPYSLGDVVSNVRFACEIGDKILAKGHIPFIPHLAHFWHFLSPKTYDEWLRIDRAFIPRCDALLRVGGESKGADLEIEVARQWGRKIYYDINDVPDARKLTGL